MTDKELLDQAYELLKGAAWIFKKQEDSNIVLNCLEVEQPANGGGDGYCLWNEIDDWFDSYADGGTTG